MVTIAQVCLRFRRGAVLHLGVAERITLDVHGVLSVPDEVHETLGRVIFVLFVPTLLVFLRVPSGIILLDDVRSVWACENVVQADDEHSYALVFLLLLELFLTRNWQVACYYRLLASFHVLLLDYLKHTILADDVGKRLLCNTAPVKR